MIEKYCIETSNGLKMDYEMPESKHRENLLAVLKEFASSFGLKSKVKIEYCPRIKGSQLIIETEKERIVRPLKVGWSLGDKAYCYSVYIGKKEND